MSENDRTDLIVVGAGLAGLAASVFAARQGMRVTVLERASEEGGNARSNDFGGFVMNLGPRALYPPAAKLLDELGVAYSGGRPALTGYALADGRLHPMPDGAAALIRSALFDGSSGSDAGAALAALTAADGASLAHVSLAQWADDRRLTGRARAYVFALVRLAGYIDAADVLSAAAARAQVLEAVGGVRYLDGGWQSLVDGLARLATTNGVEIQRRARVEAVLSDGTGATGVRLADGAVVRAPNVMLAVDPGTARSVLHRAGVTVPATTPVRAAALDLALSRLPNRDGGFIVALDRPLYLSVHSLAARLAPGDGAVVHVARYLKPDERADPAAVRAELEWLMDLVQPGWRDAVVHQRFLSNMTVTHALPAADTGGLAGRPSVAVEGLPGVFLAGDWVGEEHQLAGAALASARRAAMLAAARCAARSAARPLG